MNVTKERMEAVFKALVAVSETIRELKQVLSGVLYAQLMGIMDLETAIDLGLGYETIESEDEEGSQ